MSSCSVNLWHDNYIRNVFSYNFLILKDADGPGILEAFSTPAHSIAKVFVQTAGELDFGAIFNDGDLLYSPMAYILFISFVVLMPILFSNLLVSYIGCMWLYIPNVNPIAVIIITFDDTVIITLVASRDCGYRLLYACIKTMVLE